DRFVGARAISCSGQWPSAYRCSGRFRTRLASAARRAGTEVSSSGFVAVRATAPSSPTEKSPLHVHLIPSERYTKDRSKRVEPETSASWGSAVTHEHPRIGSSA